MTEDFVKHSIIKWLSSNGWGYFKFGALHDHGIDLIARNVKYSRYFFIEVKGQGSIPQANEVAFIYSLGQIITRMKSSKTTRNYYALGLPEISAKIAIRRIPWQVAKKLLLSIFSVTDIGKVTQHSWQDLKEFQTGNK